eukprot:s3453_g4.t1
MASSSNVAAGDNGELAVRTIVYVEDEIENAARGTWEMIADGIPFIRKLTTSFVDPRDVWPFWPYRTIFIRTFQKDRPWKVVELSRKFSDLRNPSGMIDLFLLTIGFEDECESLTLLGVEPQTLLDLGLVVVDEVGLRDELPVAAAAESSGSQVPSVLPPLDVDNMPGAIEVEPGEEIEAVAEVLEESAADSLVLHDDLVVTARSSVKLLRDAYRWLGVSQAGSKGRMFERCKKVHELALRRSMVEAAQEQYRSLQLDTVAVPVPPQPSDRDRSLHELTHTPYQPKRRCSSSPLAVDVWSRYVTMAPLKQRNAQTVGQALVKFISRVREGTVEIAFDNEPVLVAGVAFCKAAREKNGFGTIVSPNKSYDKGRTGVAERLVHTIRGLQKTLLCHVEAEIKATIPSGHVVIQWAKIHASWLYNRYNVHATLKQPHFRVCGDDRTMARL